MQHNITNVMALWPRINKTYKYDSGEMKSVPCPASDPAAAYELSFSMTPEQAKDLWAAMVKAYNEKRKPEWPEQPVNPFKRDDKTGNFIGKAKLKGNYNGELTKGVAQYDASANLLASDFMLTTNSIVNVAVTFVPYNMREAGVSMRLRAVQVLKLAESEAQNPFGATDGYTSGDSNPFAAAQTAAPAPKKAAKAKVDVFAPADDIQDEIPW